MYWGNMSSIFISFFSFTLGDFSIKRWKKQKFCMLKLIDFICVLCVILYYIIMLSVNISMALIPGLPSYNEKLLSKRWTKGTKISHQQRKYMVKLCCQRKDAYIRWFLPQTGHSVCKSREKRSKQSTEVRMHWRQRSESEQVQTAQKNRMEQDPLNAIHLQSFCPRNFYTALDIQLF